jgi:hypothetical protein
MGSDDEGERLARLEEQMRAVQAELASWRRMVFGGVAVLVALVWNKIAVMIGMGPQ